MYPFNKSTLTYLEGQKKYELKLEDVLGACSHLNFNFRHLFRKGRDLFKLRVYTYKKVGALIRYIINNVNKISIFNFVREL